MGTLKFNKFLSRFAWIFVSYSLVSCNPFKTEIKAQLTDKNTKSSPDFMIAYTKKGDNAGAASWTTVTGASYYKIIYAKDTSCKSPLITLKLSAAQSMDVDISQYKEESKVYMCVEAYKSDGTFIKSPKNNGIALKEDSTSSSSGSAPGSFAISTPTTTQSTTTPTVTWGASSGAATYQLIIASDNKCTTSLQSYTDLTATSKSLTTLSKGTYYVCVTAVNTTGTTSATNSGTFSFIVDQIPYWTSQATTASATQATAFSFTVAATDPDSDAVVYAFDLPNMNCQNKTWSSALAINSSTGVITGTPSGLTDVSTCTITATATSSGQSISQTVTVSLYPAAPGGFTCDSGTLATTCSISTTQTLANNAIIAGPGTLEIQSSGILTSAALSFISIKMGGDVNILAGGKITSNLTVMSAANINIAATGSIDVRDKGYAGGAIGAAGAGPGAGALSGAGGGGHGGAGGNGGTGSSTNDSLSAPVLVGSSGSGGGSEVGGNGGGAVKLSATGNVILNGSIIADGSISATNTAYTSGGGGAGGSIWINASSLSGNGSVSVAGGSAINALYMGGSGGGGRISFVSTTNTYVGSVSVARGVCVTNCNGGRSGSPGTFYTSITNICDTGTLDTTCTLSSTKYVGDGVSFSGVGNFVVANGGNLKAVTPIATITFSLSGDLTIQSGGKISANISSANVANVYVNSGGSIDVSGLGYQGATAQTNGAGPGATVYTGYSGGGGYHGGIGGGGSGSVNGSATAPSFFGSGGSGGKYESGGNGGGLLKLIATGTVVINGSILADGIIGVTSGGYTGGGGGAGGSIWINAPAVSGSGSISASGGAGIAATYSAGGGGGGRIALIATNYNYSGSVSVARGVCTTSSNGGQSGAPGTFYTSVTNFCDSGNLDTTCILSSSRSLGDAQSLSGTGNFVVANGGTLKTVTAIASISINISGDLTVQNGGTIAANISSANTSNIYVNTGGSIDASGLGYSGGGIRGSVLAALKGTGGGVDGGGGGASHGGIGGGSGPAVYGSNINPVTFGSGGGGSNHADGAPGGGVLKLVATTSIVVDGTVKVNGFDAIYGGAVQRPGGGGSGGSAWIIAPTISGSGSVTAKGGDHYFSGSYNGEGGGGGRVALEYTTLGLATPTAIGGNGGNGATGGTNGTVCLNGSGGSC